MSKRSFDIVSIFFNLICFLCNNEGNNITFTQICSELSLDSDELLPIIKILEENDWILLDEKGYYHVGMRMLYFADADRLNLEIVRQISQSLNELSKVCSQTVELNVIEGKDILCIYKVEPHNAIRIASRIGRQGSLYAGASGKILLAYSPESLQNLILNSPLKQYTQNTLTNPDDLIKELNKIRIQGYAESIEEYDPGAAGVAVPVLNKKGDILAEISIIGTTFDFNKYRDFWREQLFAVQKKLPTQY